MDLSKKLKMLRESHNITQDELASKLKLSRSAITNYESGIRTPDVTILNELCKLYNITLDSLFDEETEVKETPKTNIRKTIITTVSICLAIIILLPNPWLISKNFP